MPRTSQSQLDLGVELSSHCGALEPSMRITTRPAILKRTQYDAIVDGRLTDYASPSHNIEHRSRFRRKSCRRKSIVRIADNDGRVAWLIRHIWLEYAFARMLQDAQPVAFPADQTWIILQVDKSTAFPRLSSNVDVVLTPRVCQSACTQDLRRSSPNCPRLSECTERRFR